MKSNLKDKLKRYLKDTSFWQVLKCAGTPSKLINLFGRYLLLRLAVILRPAKSDADVVFVHLDLQNWWDVADFRYFYFVLYTFIQSGYQVILYLRDGLTFTSFVCYKKFQLESLFLSDLKIKSSLPGMTSDKLLLTNVNDSLTKMKWAQVLHLEPDISKPGNISNSLLLPYIMHPNQYIHGRHKELDAIRIRPRKIRVFFSGGMRESQYNRLMPGQKLNRIQIIKALPEENVLFIKTQAQLDYLLKEGDYLEKVVINNRDSAVIRDEDWLSVLADCDFFLALPGMIMPMCHNVIEAMAVGAIPILNYSDWFHPPLQSGENCLTFRGVDQLQLAISKAMIMSKAEISQMRIHVLSYYDQHLALHSFKNKVEGMKTKNINLFVNTDQEQFASNVSDQSFIVNPGRKK